MSYLLRTTMIIMAFCFSPTVNFGQNIDSNNKAVALFSETKKQPIAIAANNSKIQSGSIRSTKGYRVIIYSGIDRTKANSAKADFMRRNPGVRVYMTYALPQYKIKVGNFNTRKDADELYRQLSGIYSPCMVVPDIVEINTFHKND